MASIIAVAVLDAAVHFFDLNPESLAELCRQRGMPGYVADQVMGWVYKKNIADPAQMTNISAANRAALRESLVFCSGRIVRHQVATDDTQKLLIDWNDTKPTSQISNLKSEISDLKSQISD